MKQNDKQHIEISVELANDLGDGQDNLLLINQGKHHHEFDKLTGTNEPYTITWTLSGNASGGEFCGLDEADNPGFLWLVRTPGERIFHKLRLLGKRQLTLHNHHHDKSSEGLWHYQLFARFGGKVYGVPLTFACGAGSSNPSIKNN